LSNLEIFYGAKLAQSNRIYFFDNLRSFTILLVVVLHGIATYMAYAPSWWFVIDYETSIFFTGLVLLLDVPIMFILFFVSGYFVFPSLKKRESWQFLKNKFVRVGLPFFVGFLVFAPSAPYLRYLSQGGSSSYLEFWSHDFWQPQWFTQSVYWYLGILFLIFIMLSVIYSLSNHFRELRQTISTPTWKLFVFFAAVMTVGFLSMNMFYPLGAWTLVLVFIVQPERLPLYFGYFILGIYAYKQSWFTAKGYKPSFVYWAPLFALSGALYLGFRYLISLTAQPSIALLAGNAVLFNVFCLSSLMAGLAFFQRYVNGNSWFWKSQAANSYGIYYIHPLFLYPLAFVFVPITLSIFLKAPIVVIVGVLLSWGASVLWVKILSFLSRARANELLDQKRLVPVRI